MIRQICPSCLQPVELPDETAGTTVSCPNCDKPFAIPAGYQPTVDPGVAPATPPVPTPPPPPPPPPAPETYPMVPSDRPAPPPGFVPPAPPASPRPTLSTTAPIPADAPPPPSGYDHTGSLELSAPRLAWTAVAALTVVFFLTFFSWVGAFPGGYRVYTQMPWQTVVGRLSVHTYFDETLAEEEKLRGLVPSNWETMVPYLLFLILAVLLGWAWRLAPTPAREQLPRSVSWLTGLWPSLPGILFGLSLATLALLLIQIESGFGLETAVDQRIAEQVTKAQEAARAADKLPRPFLLGETMGRYDLQTTTALWTAVILHIIAVLAFAGWIWLARRGTKPPPRLLGQC